MNDKNFELGFREHNWVEVKRCEIVVPNATTGAISLSTCSEDLKEGFIYGLRIRQQRKADVLAADASQVRVGYKGKALLNRGDFGKAHLVLDVDGQKKIDIALEDAGYDNDHHAVGSYMQLILPEGINKNESSIYFPLATTNATDEVVEIIFLVATNKCKAQPACNGIKN